VNKGSIYPSELSAFQDNRTGVTIHRLTNHLCHSNHFYFTHWSYYGGGRKMVFHSDRGNVSNLYGIDLDSGEITQLTDARPGQSGPALFGACVNPTRDEAYFLAGDAIFAIDLGDLSERKLWQVPEGRRAGMPNCTCDGRFVCVVIEPALPAHLPAISTRNSPASRDQWELHPHAMIVRISTRDGECETVWEEDYHLGHVNTSPTVPNVATFCHEGPWRLVEQRVWGIDLETGETWPIRPQERDDVIVGHEYWFADGAGLGYHGWFGRDPGGEALWGRVDPGGRDLREYRISRNCTHMHSLDSGLIVGDGTVYDPVLILWRPGVESCEGRVLCTHYSSFHAQCLHVHPAIMPGGQRIIFTSDMHGYGNIYVVEIPEFDSLPEA